MRNAPPVSYFHRRSRRPANALCVVTAGALLLGGTMLAPTTASAAVVADPVSVSASDATIALNPIGSYETGQFDESAAEIVAYHAATQRLFVVNAQAGAVDVLDVSDPTVPAKLFTITGTGIANSVAIRADGLGVVALEAPTKTDIGTLAFFDAAGAGDILGYVTVGALPDMVTISDDGAYAVVANEGEPSEDFTIDPEGSVSVVSLPGTVTAPAQAAVATADFNDFEVGGSKTLPDDVRVFGPTVGAGNPVSRNLEPEYVAVDGGTAYAALQEANAVAVVDLATAEVTEIWPLGFKDHSIEGNGLDTSDRDPEGSPTFDIRTVDGLKGVYMPDGINAYSAGGTTYLVTANEGDAREWGTFVDGERVKNLGEAGIAPVCETSPLAGLTGDGDLGRLEVVTDLGLDETGACYEELYSYGGRSFSIWSTDGTLVFDSGDDFEQITHDAAPDNFNSGHDVSDLEGRSDAKGPEPENLAIGEVDGRTYAFIGLERVGGVMVYDITDPAAAIFTTYINNRNFAVSMLDGDDNVVGDLAQAGDLGPEGLAFIPAAGSPTGEPMLAVGNEVSGTTTLFSISTVVPPVTTSIQVLGINDFHGRIEANGDEAGAAVLAGAVSSLRAENPNTVFVSAGDNIGASTFTSFSQQDAPTIDALKGAGLQASVVGNHEFDSGFADLTERVLPRFGGAQFGLGANVYLKGTTMPALDEYWVTEVDGVRVGFIGTVTEQTASMVSPDGIAGIEFGDQLTAANRVAAQLQDGVAGNGEADVIVLLTHEGSETSDCAAVAADASAYGELVRGASDNIDAILSGHTHQKYACTITSDGGMERPVLQAHQYGTTLDRLTIEVDSASKEVVSIEGELLSLAEGGYVADAGVTAIVADAVAEAEIVGAVELGEISGDITRGGTAGSDRGVESTLGNLVADIHLWATSNPDFAGEPADIAFMNPGGLRDDLLYGTDGVVTYKEAANVQPFANSLTTFDLTGAQIAQALEQQWQPAGSSRPKLHLGVSSGFSYVYDADAAAGSRIVSMSLNGEPISATDVYRVAANSFLAAGGDNFAAFAEGTNRTDTGQVDLAATVAYFAAHPVVAPAELGRAVVAGTDWADVSIGDLTLAPGESTTVTITGLTPGQTVQATLRSELIDLGSFTADADGAVSFRLTIPASLAPGAYTLAVSSAGFETITAGVTVVAAAVPAELPFTGAAPGAAALLGVLLVGAGGLLVARRRWAFATARATAGQS